MRRSRPTHRRRRRSSRSRVATLSTPPSRAIKFKKLALGGGVLYILLLLGIQAGVRLSRKVALAWALCRPLPAACLSRLR